MPVVGHQPPPFFKRGPAPLARLVFFVILSLVLLVLDLKYRYLELARHGVATALYPLQRAAYAPVDLYEQLGGYFSSLAVLQQENAQLKRKELESANWLLRQQHLELENQRLRALLDMKDRQPVSGTIAEILYKARDPFSRRVVVDKGSQHDLVPGQAVVDEAGVLGQVTRVYPLQSEVTLVTDNRPYFDWVLEQLPGTGFDGRTHAVGADYGTKFERKWVGGGQERFHRLDLVKTEHQDLPLSPEVPMRSHVLSGFDPGAFQLPHRVLSGSGADPEIDAVTGGVTRAWGGVNGFSFVNNLVDWMTGSDDLVALRTRGSAVRRLDEIEPSTATTAQTLNYVAAPLLVLIAGILVFVVRKYRS